VCGPDLELLPLIDHANIACGFHAGDPLIMQETVRNCKKYNIKVGAHPGLPDIQGEEHGYGSKTQNLTRARIRSA